MTKYSIRPAHKDDINFLWKMLYESLFVPEGQQPFEKEIVHEPHISKYVEGWGREGDFGFLAMNGDGKPIGSVTVRYFDESNKGFGYVSSDVPELGMAVLEEYRGKRIGTALMNEAFKECMQRKIQKLSLSVDPRNTAAMKLYKRFGFEEAGQVDSSIVMVVDLAPGIDNFK